MNMNLIDFPPWRKSGGALEDIPLLAQDLVLAAQPLQLGRDVLLGLDRWIIQALLAVAIHPGPQGGQSDPEILRNLPPRAPARLGKAHGLVSELWCKSSRMRHGAPPRSRESSPLSRNKSRPDPTTLSRRAEMASHAYTTTPLLRPTMIERRGLLPTGPSRRPGPVTVALAAMH